MKAAKSKFSHKIKEIVIQTAPTPNKKHVCSICSFSQYERTKVFDHIRLNHGIPVANCNSYINVAYLAKTKYYCLKCEFSSTIKNQAIAHFKQIHDALSIVKVEVEEFQCDKCDLSFTNTLNLDEHRVEVHQCSIYMCDQCAEIFTDHPTLSHHKSKSHTAPTGFKCQTCNLTKFQESELNKHIATTHMKQVAPIYECEKCAKTFGVIKDFHEHLATHEDKKYPCKQCKKAFENENSLNSHVIVAHMSLFHKCKLCEQSFAGESFLRKHVIKAHNPATDEKTYIRCGFCDKVFMVEKDKDFHEMTEHAEQYSIKKLKTFKCDSCSETFFGQFALKQHSKTHHENK